MLYLLRVGRGAYTVVLDIAKMHLRWPDLSVRPEQHSSLVSYYVLVGQEKKTLNDHDALHLWEQQQACRDRGAGAVYAYLVRVSEIGAMVGQQTRHGGSSNS